MIVNGEVPAAICWCWTALRTTSFAAVAQAARPYLLSREKKDGSEHHHLDLPWASRVCAAASRSTAGALAA